MELNLRLLETLLAVAEHGSISRAAHQLHLSQQAVSAQVQQLERLTGSTLLVRTSRGVSLTPAGQVLADRATVMLGDADRMLADVRMVSEGLAGRVRVAFKARSTAHFMPQVLQALERDAPDIRVEVTSVSTLAEEIDLLVDGHVDAAFVWLPVGDDRLTATEVLTEPRVVAVPPGHPLDGIDAIELADVADDPLIGPWSELPDDVARFWAADPRPDGTTPRQGPEARTPEECLHHVAAGQGVWIAPASSADYFSYPRVHWAVLTDAAPAVLALAALRTSDVSTIATFADYCRSVAARSQLLATDGREAVHHVRE